MSHEDMHDDHFFDQEKISHSERDYEVRLRPTNFDEYIGQKKVVQNVELMSKSALKRNQAMDHFLLSGPPGLGKTSLAMLTSKELGSQLHVISAPALERKGDLAAILSNLNDQDVLFIDEIHRLHISIEEILYSAMEDFKLDIVIGQGPAARTVQIDLLPFTLIGATTRAGLLSNPLRDRFMAHLNFDFYQPQDLSKIIEMNAKKLGLNVTEDARLMMGQCCRGTPRIANRILRRVRDYALVHEREVIDREVVKIALSMLEIDDLGLDSMDRKILTVIRDYYQNGPVGIDALSATLGEDKQTIEDVYEPYLLKEGLLIRTPRGRMLSEKSIDHLN